MIPKTIWMLWLQGWDNAPPVVQGCVNSWRQYNPQWDIRLLTAADLPGLLPDDPGLFAVRNKKLPPEAFSNLVRLALLRRYGGVWADATTYCLVPLDTWVHDAASSGFFGFANPGPDRMLSSWFMAAQKDQILLSIWQHYCVAYWQAHEERHTYFWFHGTLFAKAYAENQALRDVWDNTVKISADGPHYFLPYNDKLLSAFSENGIQALIEASIPLLKLTHKFPEGSMEPGNVLPFLLERIDRDPVDMAV